MPFFKWIGRQRKGYAYISKPRSCKDICNARQVYAPTPLREKYGIGIIGETKTGVLIGRNSDIALKHGPLAE